MGKALTPKRKDIDDVIRQITRPLLTLVDLIGTDEGADIEFEPGRPGLTACTPGL